MASIKDIDGELRSTYRRITIRLDRITDYVANHKCTEAELERARGKYALLLDERDLVIAAGKTLNAA